MQLDKNNIQSIITEELTKSEITTLITNKLDTNLNSREFKKKVKELAADVVNEMFKILWQRSSFWKSSVASN